MDHSVLDLQSRRDIERMMVAVNRMIDAQIEFVNAWIECKREADMLLQYSQGYWNQWNQFASSQGNMSRHSTQWARDIVLSLEKELKTH